jgi:chloramphenicol-sensitive protein RarD
MNSEHEQSRLGLLFGLGAYGLWGLIPLYFRALRHMPPAEVLAHRIVWSFVLLLAMLAVWRRLREVGAALRTRAIIARLAASTVLIGINWFTYIYAVSVERVLETSLGYFITPLVNVVLGMVFLKERLRPVQLVALTMAAAGVLNLALREEGVPWIALTLAFSFALYGLMRKTVAVDASLGLFVETLLLTPAALLLLATFAATGQSEALDAGWPTFGLVVLGGLVTTVPLLLFAGAARRLRMATLGFLQYLAPSIQFLLAVLAFGEPLSQVRLLSFICIWVAVALYSGDTLWAYRTRRVRERQVVFAAPKPATCSSGTSSS